MTLLQDLNDKEKERFVRQFIVKFYATYDELGLFRKIPDDRQSKVTIVGPYAINAIKQFGSRLTVDDIFEGWTEGMWGKYGDPKRFSVFILFEWFRRKAHEKDLIDMRRVATEAKISNEAEALLSDTSKDEYIEKNLRYLADMSDTLFAASVAMIYSSPKLGFFYRWLREKYDPKGKREGHYNSKNEYIERLVKDAIKDLT